MGWDGQQQTSIATRRFSRSNHYHFTGLGTKKGGRGDISTTLELLEVHIPFDVLFLLGGNTVIPYSLHSSCKYLEDHPS